MTLYDALKASKGLPVSDSYAALWGKSAAESGIKTLTGKLPLYFKTTEFKLRDWTIYGNNDVGKNKLEITAGASTKYNVTFTPDSVNGTIIATGQCNPPTVNQAQYDFGGGIQPIPDSFRQVLILEDDGLIAGTQLAIAFYDSSNTYITGVICDGTTKSKRVTVPDNATYYKAFVRKTASAGNVDVTFKPMLRPANSSAAFEPYRIGVGEKTENGYVLNIIVGFAPISEQPVTHIYSSKAINLGENPLTQGRTVSMSEFGDIRICPSSDLFIAAVETLDLGAPLSYNQPTMMIKFKE